MKRTSLMITRVCWVDGFFLALCSSRSFLKYSANCLPFPGTPKTPTNRSGRTHNVDSLSVTIDLGLKPTGELPTIKQ